MKLIECRDSNIDDLIKDRYGYGSKWNELCGPEMVHKYLLQEVKLNDRVLDLYSGYGRSSIPLLLAGGKLTLVDNSKVALEKGIGLIQEAKMIDQLENVLIQDVKDLCNKKDLGKFRFVIATDAIVHILKSDAFDFVKELPGYLEKSGGFIYINVPSKLSDTYENAVQNLKRIDNLDTYEDYCGCSGEEKLEPISFYLPGELESVFKNCGGEIIEAKSTNGYCPGSYNWSIVARF